MSRIGLHHIFIFRDSLIISCGVQGIIIFLCDFEQAVIFLSNASYIQVGFCPDGKISEHETRKSNVSDTVTLLK